MALKSKAFFLQSTALPMSVELRGKYHGTQLLQYPTQKPEERSKYHGTQLLQYPTTKPEFRAKTISVQYIITAPEINPMTSQTFPELKGLMFETHAKPTFSTKIAQHTSGKETRTSFWQYPTWEFDLMYDYLPNDPTKTIGETDLKTLMGFFMEMGGSFETFFFKAPDDFHVEDELMLVGDGTEVAFTLYRPMRGFKEPIGYLNAPTMALWWMVSEETIAISGGHTAQLRHPNVQNDANLIVHSNAGSGADLVRVGSAPAAGQYSINFGTGLITVNAALAGTLTVGYKAIATTDDWLYLPANQINMTTAPQIGESVYASYDFWFVCRFADDQNDFDQFMDKLWEIQQLNLQSVLT